MSGREMGLRELCGACGADRPFLTERERMLCAVRSFEFDDRIVYGIAAGGEDSVTVPLKLGGTMHLCRITGVSWQAA